MRSMPLLEWKNEISSYEFYRSIGRFNTDNFDYFVGEMFEIIIK